jgi:hypothetical protein
VQKALSREPQQRFQSVQEFAEALEQASQGKMPATLNTPQDTGSLSVTQKVQPGQTNIPTYRNEPGSGAIISSGAPDGPIAGTPAGQRPRPSTSSPTYHSAPTQSSSTPPIYTPPAYTPPLGAMTPPPYGQPYPVQPQKKSNSGRYIVVIVVLVLALLGVGSLALTNFASRFASPGGTTFTVGSSNSNSSSGTTAMQTTGSTKSGTPAKDGTFPKNIRLTCGGCNDPVVVTITAITLDSGKGRMVWDLSLYNNTAQTYSYAYFYFEEFSLQEAADTDKVQASGDIVGTIGMTDIPAEQSITTTCIFSFIPIKGEEYTLNVKMFMYPTSGVNLNPVSFTFS